MIFRRASVCLLALASLASARAAESAAPAITPAPSTTPGAPPGQPAPPAAPKVSTVIESGSAEMVSTVKETIFTFRDGVTVTGTNMKMTCDLLEVVALRSGDPEATFGKQENFKSLIATGRVRIVQNDREAVCDRAEVFPGDDKVILSGNPKVRSLDGQYEASGPKMELHRGERRARIIGDTQERPRITLPPLKDLGYEKEKERKKDADKDKKEPKETEPAAPAPESASPVITVPSISPPPQPPTK